MNCPPFSIIDWPRLRIDKDHLQTAAGKRLGPFLLLLVLVFLIYSNTFDASWHLDDRHSILGNTKIQIEELTPRSLIRAMQHPEKEVYWRPLAYLSFALNWLVGGRQVFEYHLVNVSIHFLSAFLLFLTIFKLFETPALRATSRDNVYFTAVFAAALWAANPIQTQAVTYIVQRMTLLATLFYIIGIFFYLKARLTDRLRNRILLYPGIAASFILGVSSKEMAALLPLSLVLIEAVFFQDLRDARARKKIWMALGIGIILIAILAGVFFLTGDPLSVFSGYGDRYFTPAERLMTQPRVLVFYLSQIFWPLPARLSIEHDFDVSTSWLHPWSTLPALIFILALNALAVYRVRQKPLFGFAVLFFFLNHLIESSFVPLELAFEHRNYLPSLFLFTPLAAGAARLLTRTKDKDAVLHYALVTAGICVLAGFGWGAYIRNNVWKTEVTLWEDAVQKAPGLHRPLHNLAMARYENSGRLEEALELYLKALDLKMHRRSHRARLYGNIANIYARTGRLVEAEAWFQRAYDAAPFVDENRYRLAETLALRQKWNAALAHLDALLSRSPKNTDYLNLKGTVLMHQGRAEEALQCFRDAIRGNPRQPTGYIHAAAALTAIGAYSHAEKLFSYALKIEPDRLMTHLRLIDVHLRSGDLREADVLIRHLVGSASVDDIKASLAELGNEPLFDPGAYRTLSGIVATAIQRHMQGMLTEGSKN